MVEGKCLTVLLADEEIDEEDKAPPVVSSKPSKTRNEEAIPTWLSFESDKDPAIPSHLSSVKSFTQPPANSGILGRVSDPYTFFTDPEPAFLNAYGFRSGSGSRALLFTRI